MPLCCGTVKPLWCLLLSRALTPAYKGQTSDPAFQRCLLTSSRMCLFCDPLKFSFAFRIATWSSPNFQSSICRTSHPAKTYSPWQKRGARVALATSSTWPSWIRPQAGLSTTSCSIQWCPSYWPITQARYLTWTTWRHTGIGSSVLHQLPGVSRSRVVSDVDKSFESN